MRSSIKFLYIIYFDLFKAFSYIDNKINRLITIVCIVKCLILDFFLLFLQKSRKQICLVLSYLPNPLMTCPSLLIFPLKRITPGMDLTISCRKFQAGYFIQYPVGYQAKYSAWLASGYPVSGPAKGKISDFQLLDKIITIK